MIENFNEIEQFMEFEKGHFYKFSCLVRNTDGENKLYQEGYSNVNKNILIKTWCIDSQEYYNKIKNEMKELCNMTGARLYIGLDRKNQLKVVQECLKGLSDIMVNYCMGSSIPSAKSLNKFFASKTSVAETSDHSHRTLMWDVDTQEEVFLESVLYYIKANGQTPMVLTTRKGYHVVCYKKFNCQSWGKDCVENFNKLTGEEIDFEEYNKLVNMKPNELGLVYAK